LEGGSEAVSEGLEIDCAEHSQTRVGEEGDGTAADEQGAVEVNDSTEPRNPEPRNPGELQGAGIG